ncbi:MAG: PilX N-terminal domain-containing pilus assembly protein [Gemmatimonadaceae bacterium]
MIKHAPFTSRRGFVLPMVVFAIAIMSIVAMAIFNTATDERRASRATRESTLALYAAEAGLRQTYGSWPVAAVKALNPGDSLDLGWKNLPNKAAYRAVVHRVDKGGLQEYNVVVQGRRTDPTAGVITIVGAAGGQPVFKYAVRTDSALYLDNGGLFDSYDSDAGSYAATVDTMANLWSNTNVYVAKTTVKGSASAAGNITYGQNGYITGATASAATALPPLDILPCPPGGFTPTAKVPTGPGVSYSAVGGVLTVSGGQTLNLTDTSYYFSSIVLTGNSKVVFPGSPRASVMLRDSLNASSGSIVNTSAVSSNLSFSSCGTSATPAYWALSSNGSTSSYSVYAPNHVVYELGAGDFYGAVVAWIYYASGGGKFHYDAALARQSSNKVAVQRGSWAQLPGG